MPDTVHDGTPLGAVDTAWLHMEDPTNLMMVTGLFLVDGPLEVDDLRETLRERMIERFPRLSHRVHQEGSSAFWERIGTRSGATINDVLLTAVAGGLRRYLAKRGVSTGGLEIHAMVPVNLRPPEHADDLGNQFGLIYLALPVGVADRQKRLQLVKERMEAIKRSPEPVVGFQLLGALGLAPRKVAEVLVNLFGSKSTAVMTNVIGPRQPVYFCGRRVGTVMFWVPQSGRMGLGVSIFSYDGRVVVGVATDRGLVPDPESIVAAFEAEFTALRGWAEQRTRRSARGPSKARAQDGLGSRSKPAQKPR